MTKFNFLSSTSQINLQPPSIVLYHNNLFTATNEVKNNNFFQNYTSHINNPNLATTSSTMQSIAPNQSAKTSNLHSSQLKGMDRKVLTVFSN